MGENHKGVVPFSWEQKPGVSKVAPQFHFQHPKLPPPPCGAARSSVSYHRDLQVPLPPCTFQAAAALRNPSQKGAMMRKQVDDDPFLIAFKECTKSARSSNNRFAWFSRDDAAASAAVNKTTAKKKKKKKKNRSSSSSSNPLFSCKNSCSVMEDKVIRVSQLPLSRSHGEEDVCMKWTP